MELVRKDYTVYVKSDKGDLMGVLFHIACPKVVELENVDKLLKLVNEKK